MNKNERFTIRLSDSEKTELQILAKEHRRSGSEILRDLLKTELSKNNQSVGFNGQKSKSQAI